MVSSILVKARRGLAYLGYYGLATHLPRSYAPGGALGRALRGYLAGILVDHAGTGINVEHGATFGSGRGLTIGHRSGLGIDVEVMGSLRLGDDVMMGPRCVFISTNHRIADTDRPMNSQGGPEDDRPIVVEDDVWFGANVTVTAGVHIGRGAVVAAGAVVTGDVPPYSVVGGVPARVLRSRLDEPRA